MKRALLFLTAGIVSLLLFGSIAGCGDQDMAPAKTPASNNDQVKSEVKDEVKPEVKAEAGAIQPSAAVPAPAVEEEEEEEDQFGC